MNEIEVNQSGRNVLNLALISLYQFPTETDPGFNKYTNGIFSDMIPIDVADT